MTEAKATPFGWTTERDAQGALRLSYAVRGGKAHAVLLPLGAALVLGGGYGLYALLAGGGLTIAGFVFLLVPAGVVLAGVYVFDIALHARTTYAVSDTAFRSGRESLFGGRATEIPRAAIRAIAQRYSPPGASAPASSPGDWVTFIRHVPPRGKQVRELALIGMHTPEEAKWLAALLVEALGVPLQRGFGAEAEEADPAELPDPDRERTPQP